MLSPRLTNCPECANIPSLLKKIDCKLAELGNNLYNNISYMLNKPVPSSDILQLIGYRRILMYKYCNPSYVEKYSVQMIASRVIRLTAGCVSKCNELERCLEEPCDIKIVPNPTTTSTSTLPTTTTTSTTVMPTTTTTSSSSTSTTTSTTAVPTTTTTTTSGIYYYTANRFVCPDCETADPNVRIVSSPTVLNIGEWYPHFYVPTEVSFYITGNSTYDPMAIPVDANSGSVTCTCPEVTTTTTSSSSTSTTTSTSSSTTTSTTTIPYCVTECLPLFSKGNGVFIYVVKDNQIVDLTSQITGPVGITGDIANTLNKLWLYNSVDISEYDITSFCPFAATYNKNIDLLSGTFGSGMTAIDDVTLVGSIGTNIVEIDVATTTAGITVKFPMPTNRDISGDLIYTTSNQLICSYVDNITSDTYITIHDYSTGAIILDVNISSITEPWGLYIDAGTLYVCDNNGQIFSLDLNTEVLTLAYTIGQSLNGASQNPECAVLTYNPTTTTTTTV